MHLCWNKLTYLTCIPNRSHQVAPAARVTNAKSSLTAEESGLGMVSSGARPGPGAAMASGLGGLGLEGISGTEESLGERSEPPGEGNRGVMSGDNAGGGAADGANAESGSSAGAAEMDEAGRSCPDDKNCMHEKAIRSVKIML